MNHTINFDTRDDLLTWMDENFSDAKLTSSESGSTIYETDDCILRSKGKQLVLTFKSI
jgi:hypothetical protein